MFSDCYLLLHDRNSKDRSMVQVWYNAKRAQLLLRKLVPWREYFVVVSTGSIVSLLIFVRGMSYMGCSL
jgi:hypothetical protein